MFFPCRACTIYNRHSRPILVRSVRRLKEWANSLIRLTMFYWINVESFFFCFWRFAKVTTPSWQGAGTNETHEQVIEYVNTHVRLSFPRQTWTDIQVFRRLAGAGLLRVIFNIIVWSHKAVSSALQTYPTLTPLLQLNLPDVTSSAFHQSERFSSISFAESGVYPRTGTPFYHVFHHLHSLRIYGKNDEHWELLLSSRA